MESVRDKTFLLLYDFHQLLTYYTQNGTNPDDPELFTTIMAAPPIGLALH